VERNLIKDLAALKMTPKSPFPWVWFNFRAEVVAAQGIRRLNALKGVALLLILGISGCLQNEPIPEPPIVQGGGSSETTNGIVMGRVLDSTGHPAGGASLRLRDRSFLADTGAGLPRRSALSLDAVTDADGYFKLDSLDPGGYLIEARGFNGGSALFEVGVVAGDSILLTPRNLGRDATVSGEIALDSGSADQGFVQIFGLDRVQRVDPATGRFTFTDLPAGIYTLKASTSSQKFDPHILTGVQAVAAQSTDIGTILVANFDAEVYSTWPQHRRIYLNTTTGGAAITDTLFQFPVLVRLDTKWGR
jgi:hypothetical protein